MAKVIPDQATRLERARAARQQQIRVLRACECSYPLVRYRNGTGHAKDCPAHPLMQAPEMTERLLTEREKARPGWRP